MPSQSKGEKQTEYLINDDPQGPVQAYSGKALPLPFTKSDLLHGPCLLTSVHVLNSSHMFTT
jgi:hypothetical protein